MPEGFARFLNPGRDLLQIANLLEEAFGEELSRGGRRAIRELRILGYLGPLAWLLLLIDPGLEQGLRGLVWDVDGRVVGNVSFYPSASDRWQISNMAVAAPYRRRGIARRLMKAALTHIYEQSARWVTLQVREGNLPALRLYESLGFERVGAIREMELTEPPRRLAPSPWGGEIREFHPADWVEEYQLAEESVPQGLQWLYPFSEAQFRPWAPHPLLNKAAYLVQGYHLHHIVALESGRMVASAALWLRLLGREHRLQFLVHPDAWGKVEEALVDSVLAPVRKGPRGRIWTRIPAEYEILAQTLEKAGFRTTLVLVQMRLDMETLDKEVLADESDE